MLDERSYIAQLESADAERLRSMLLRPTREEEDALRQHLGDARYERLHALALRQATRGPGEKRGNVVVIHGIMGGELSTVDAIGDRDRVWLHYPRILGGAFARLELDAGGRDADPGLWVEATGMLKRSYGEQLLTLSDAWNVRPFWFDWRRDLNEAADRLDAAIGRWFGDRPVHVVAHSMGGLVARLFTLRHPERWARMWDTDGAGAAGGRLLMLGTPNHGSYAVPQILTGLEGMVRLLVKADLRHGRREVQRIVNSFVGTYQMLPSPWVHAGAERLYDAATYGSLGIAQEQLDRARGFHESLRPAVDPERMLYVAGYDQPTLCGIREGRPVDARESYEVTADGDGRVPHSLGLLDGVPAYYVEESHGDLPGNARVLAATGELLATGETDRLPSALPADRGAGSEEQLRVRLMADLARAEDEVEVLARRFASRGDQARERRLTPDERTIEELIARGWQASSAPATRVPQPGVAAAADGDFQHRIEIALEHAGIESFRGPKRLPVDAVAVGHYVGVRPQNAELALDRALSGALLGLEPGAPVPPDALVLTQFTDRGTLEGELGRTFLLPDPRGPGRVVAIAGMGLPGRFGASQAAVLSRELCWAVGRLGKRHLSTVLIGAGPGNLPVREAVIAWLRGVCAALSTEGGAGALERVTFVEADPARIAEIDAALAAESARIRAAGAGDVAYTGWTEAGLRRLEPKIREREDAELTRVRRLRAEGRGAGASHADAPPTRVTLGLEPGERFGTYRFGAITESAAIPERDVAVDPRLVAEANDGLPAMADRHEQLERGRFLQQLLVPAELRAGLATDAPLVMMLDAATARIHWEMVAQPDALPAPGGDYTGCFLGTARGFTRQLRTHFAPLPEAPPPPHEPTRVLVVADPAEDARLPGAEREGHAVAELFREAARRREGTGLPAVEVDVLFGPARATRTRVLQALMNRRYDVLHFAGHCVYDAADPAASGWIFSGGQRLSARELRRVDRIPKFVFSNACESGVTPERPYLRSAALAPSFAEAFFERGVADFVCTAWPVADDAALVFALTLYARLLGLSAPGAPEAGPAAGPQPMHVAMREARLAALRAAGGARTWGAYQHYGNPYFRLLRRVAAQEMAHGEPVASSS